MNNQENKTKNLENVGKRKLYGVITGAVAGFINGLFGGGGGMIVVPMLTRFLRKNTKPAHATAILIILPLSIISGIFYSSFGNIDFKIALPVGIGVVVGGIIGALLLKKLSSKIVVMIFSVVMAVAGIKMLFF